MEWIRRIRQTIGPESGALILVAVILTGGVALMWFAPLRWLDPYRDSIVAVLLLLLIARLVASWVGRARRDRRRAD